MNSSTVAQLTAARGFKIDDSAPYAELWMGTHVNGPARLSDGTLLSTYIKSNATTVLGR